MTEELGNVQDQMKRMASRASGLSPAERLFACQVRLGPYEAALLRLPPLPRNPLQRSDTGERYFVVGYSDPTGIANNDSF